MWAARLLLPLLVAVGALRHHAATWRRAVADAETAAVSAGSLAPRAFVAGGVLRLLQTSGTGPRTQALGPAGGMNGAPPPPQHGTVARWFSKELRPGRSLVAPEYPWDLVPTEKIGEGRWSTVWKARLTTADGLDQDVAVKVIDATWEHARPTFTRETAIMEMLSGGPFIEYVGWWEARDSMLLIMELADGDVERDFDEASFESVGLRARLRLFSDLLDGLRMLADRGCIHRDIKPANLLLKTRPGQEPRLRIGDFGSACIPSKPELCGSEVDHHCGSKTGTFLYRAPEGWAGEWTPRSDVYSAGMTLYRLMFEGRYPPLYYDMWRQRGILRFDSNFQQAWQDYDIREDRLLAAAKALAEATKEPWLSQLAALVERMMDRDARTRLDAAEARLALAGILSLAAPPSRAEALAREAVSAVIEGPREWSSGG